MNKQSLYQEYKMEDLLPIVADLAQKFTSNESSSITYERANELMEAVIYCIRELDWDTKADCLRGEGVTLTAKEAYELGYEMVLDKTKRVHEQFNAMIPTFESYGNVAYYETVANGIPGFFLYYDPKFRPQDHILTLDYPVLQPRELRCGIDVMERYVNGICVEQQFLNRLPKEYVASVLEAYQPEYKELFLNVSTIVMRNVLGCMLADKQVGQAGFTKEQYEYAREQINGKPLEKLEAELSHLLSIFLSKGYAEQKDAMFRYFSMDLKDFAFELKNAAKHKALSAILVF